MALLPNNQVLKILSRFSFHSEKTEVRPCFFFLLSSEFCLLTPDSFYFIRLEMTLNGSVPAFSSS
jgi:hypothetical protein